MPEGTENTENNFKRLLHTFSVLVLVTEKSNKFIYYSLHFFKVCSHYIQWHFIFPPLLPKWCRHNRLLSDIIGNSHTVQRSLLSVCRRIISKLTMSSRHSKHILTGAICSNIKHILQFLPCIDLSILACLSRDLKQPIMFDLTLVLISGGTDEERSSLELYSSQKKELTSGFYSPQKGKTLSFFFSQASFPSDSCVSELTACLKNKQIISEQIVLSASRLY